MFQPNDYQFLSDYNSPLQAIENLEVLGLTHPKPVEKALERYNSLEGLSPTYPKTDLLNTASQIEKVVNDLTDYKAKQEHFHSALIEIASRLALELMIAARRSGSEYLSQIKTMVEPYTSQYLESVENLNISSEFSADDVITFDAETKQRYDQLREAATGLASSVALVRSLSEATEEVFDNERPHLSIVRPLDLDAYLALERVRKDYQSQAYTCLMPWIGHLLECGFSIELGVFSPAEVAELNAEYAAQLQGSALAERSREIYARLGAYARIRH